MIVDTNELESGSTIQCDLCIIGAGAAGISIAREFDNTKLNVWLVESGGLEYESDTQNMYKGQSIGRKYPPLDVTRLRYLGGTTNHWNGLCRPLDEIDFQKRDWIAHSGWPFDRNHLLPWYKKAQSVCELNAFEYGIDYWLPEEQKSSPFKSGRIRPTMYQQSPPTRFGESYRKQLKDSSNITVCLHANVTHLQANNPPVLLRHLNIESLQGKKITIRPRVTVLACGSIENARLLLAANDVESNGLGNHHDNVGRYFMDHLTITSGALLTTKTFLSRFWYEYRIKGKPRRQLPTLLLDDELQRAEKIGNYSVILRPPARSIGVASFRRLEGQLDRGKGIDNFWQHLGNIIGDVKEVSSMLYYRYSDEENNTIEPRLYQQWEQVPNPNSRVKLSTNSDSLGLPRAELDWQLSDIDRRTLAAGQQALAREVGQLGLGRLRIDTAAEKVMPKDVMWDNHQLGTTRMHESAKQSVVDGDCRLHTVNNLYVAGGSVFPTSGSTNPTLTVVALALRLADHLREKLE